MITGAGDRLAKLFQGFLDDPLGDALVVVEAGELAARSSLRGAFEDCSVAAAIGCYADDARALQTLIEDMVAEAGKRILPEAVAWLTDNLGTDRMVTRGEIAKQLDRKRTRLHTRTK